MNKQYYVYIVSNWTGERVYTGITNDLQRRIFEHKRKMIDGFTKKYNLDRLVFFEIYNDAVNAISREKEIKAWRREKKNRLVESVNPAWTDLSDEWYEDPFGPLARSGMIDQGS